MPIKARIAAAAAFALALGGVGAGTSLAASGSAAATQPALAAAAAPADSRPALVDRTTLPRTIVTTDGEWDDQNSMIRLLYYANDLDIAGLVYGSANHHW